MYGLGGLEPRKDGFTVKDEERAGETDAAERQEAARSARMQAALRSDTVNMLHGELRLGKPCPVCRKQIRRNDGSGAYRKEGE